jgi:hypothetical protein
LPWNDDLALDLDIPADLRSHLDTVSALEETHPYVFFGSFFQNMINGEWK